MGDGPGDGAEAVLEQVDVSPHADSVLEFFHDRSPEVATVHDLAAFVRERAQPEREETEIAVRLHHVTLPQLESAGLVEYDGRSHTVRYRDDEPASE